MMKDNASKPRNIRERTFEYALRAVKLCRYVQQRRDGVAQTLGRQLLRAATSVGANVEEAQAGESKADFIHKYSIAQKEARESAYWLRLLAESRLVPKKRLFSLLQETEEILSVITAIIVKTKKGKRR